MKFLLTLISLLLALPAAQADPGFADAADSVLDTRNAQISQISLSMNPATGLCEIVYDLTGSALIPAEVTAYYSVSGTDPWVPLPTATGEIGPGYLPAAGRHIHWNYAADHLLDLPGLGATLYLRVWATVGLNSYGLELTTSVNPFIATGSANSGDATVDTRTAEVVGLALNVDARSRICEFAYNQVGSLVIPAHISASYSLTGNPPWAPLPTVTGDIGSGYYPGTGRVARWNFTADRVLDLPGLGSLLYLRMTAYTPTSFLATATQTVSASQFINYYANGFATSGDSIVDTRTAVPSNVELSLNQSLGKLVIRYDLASSAGAYVRLAYSVDGGTTWTFAHTFTRSAGMVVAAGNGKLILWDFLADLGSTSTATSLQVRVITTVDGTHSADSAPFPISVRRASHPPQQVNFCFGEAWPRTLTSTNPFLCSANNPFKCGLGRLLVLQTGQTPAATGIGAQTQTLLMSQVQAAFAGAGVTTGLTYSQGAPVANAINIHFVNRSGIFPGLDGHSDTPGKSGPDTYNAVPSGTVGIFFDPTNLANMVETTVHEVGHCLGLWHVDPGNVDLGYAGLGWNQCVMDYLSAPAGTSLTTPISFFDAPAELANPETHMIQLPGMNARTNERYHLLRWVEGLPQSQITSQPGLYDTTEIDGAAFRYLADLWKGSNRKVALPNSPPLYLVQVLQAGTGGEGIVLAEYPVLTTAQLANLEIPVTGAGAVTIIGASTLNGDVDSVVVAPQAAGLPSADLSLEGQGALQLLRVTAGSGTVASTGTSTVAPVAKAPTQLVATVVGEQTAPAVNLNFPTNPGQTYAIERSSTLSQWTEVTRFTAADTLLSWTGPAPPAGEAHLFYRVNGNPAVP